MEKNKDNLLVSVVIPIYNGEKTLNQCLNSVLNQDYEDYEDYEVILVNNNSTDNTLEIIKEFQKKDKNKRIRYLFEPKMGRGPARNAGGRKAKGDIILMTDSDCIAPKNWVSEMIEPIVKSGQVAVQGIKKAKKVNYWTKHIEQEEERQARERIKEDKAFFIDTANFAIKKSVLKEVGYANPNLKYNEDTELMIQLKIKGYKVHFKKFAVLHYHPDTALKVFKKYLKRAEWDQKIKKMHPSKKYLSDSDFIINFVYVLNIFLELLTLHKSFRYDSVTGLAWRIGNFYGWIKK